MNIDSYISSGILSDYVLGLTTKQETLEIEQLAGAHPEILAEIELIQNSLEQYAHQFKVTPPAMLKDKIWSSLAEPSETKIIELNKNYAPFNYSKWMAAASIILLIGSGVLIGTLYNQLKTSQKEFTELTAKNESLAEQFTFLMQPSTKIVALKGVPKFADALATVYWNKDQKEVYIAVNNLPAPPSDKQYQLWAIVDGKPVDAGMLEIGKSKNGIQKMKGFETAQAFAITLEKKGGNASPTMEAMYVIGSI